MKEIDMSTAPLNRFYVGIAHNGDILYKLVTKRDNNRVYGNFVINSHSYINRYSRISGISPKDFYIWREVSLLEIEYYGLVNKFQLTKNEIEKYIDNPHKL